MKRHVVACIFSVFIAALPGFSQTHLVGIGDSLGEGDQSANAFTDSQQQTYLNYVAIQAKVPLQLPLIQSNPLGFVGLVNNRSRISPTTQANDLAVSGAKVADVLNTAANSTIQTEADLVLSPNFGMTQIQVAEQLQPGIVYCWVGNDDLINYVLDFTHLNAPTGVTSLADFTASYQELMTRLKATGAKVVVANTPDLTKIAFMIDNDDLTKYTGTNYNLPPGSLTTLGTMILLKLGLVDSSVLSDPAYVLGPDQIVSIQAQIAQYNQVISQQASAQGFGFVDAYGILNSYITNPVTIDGVTITVHFNGGAFSLDGIHPSDIGYAIFANAFIRATNRTYGTAIPLISQSQELSIVQADPFVDHDGNGVVPGRPRTGLLETLAPLLGFSGDKREHSPANAATFMRAFFSATGRDPNTSWTKQDAIQAVKQMLGSRQ